MLRTHKSGRYVNKIEFAKALSYGIANHILKHLCNEGTSGSDQMSMDKLLAGYKQITGKTLDSNSQTKPDKIKLGVAGAVDDMLTSVQKGVDFKNMYPSKTDGGSKKNKNQLPEDKDMTPEQRRKMQMEARRAGQNASGKQNIIGDSNRRAGLNNGTPSSSGRPGGRGAPGVLGGSGERSGIGGRSGPGGPGGRSGTGKSGGQSKTRILDGRGGPGARSEPGKSGAPGAQSGAGRLGRPGGLGGRGGPGGSDVLIGRGGPGGRSQKNKGKLSSSMTDSSKDKTKKLNKSIANKGGVGRSKSLTDNNKGMRLKGAANSGDLGKLQGAKTKEQSGQGGANNLQSSRKPGQSSKPNAIDSSQERKTSQGKGGKSGDNGLGTKSGNAKDGKQRGKNGVSYLSDDDNQNLPGNRRKGELGSKNINYHPSRSDDERDGKGGKGKGKTDDLKKQGGKMSSGETDRDGRLKTPGEKQTDGYGKDGLGKGGHGKDGHGALGKDLQCDRDGYVRGSNLADTKIKCENICQEKPTQAKNICQIECPRQCAESTKIYEASKKGSRFEVKQITKREYCQNKA